MEKKRDYRVMINPFRSGPKTLLDERAVHFAQTVTTTIPHILSLAGTAGDHVATVDQASAENKLLIQAVSQKWYRFHMQLTEQKGNGFKHISLRSVEEEGKQKKRTIHDISITHSSSKIRIRFSQIPQGKKGFIPPLLTLDLRKELRGQGKVMVERVVEREQVSWGELAQGTLYDSMIDGMTELFTVAKTIYPPEGNKVA